MSDHTLTQHQARALLEKLAHDDSFRALFETAPARALHVLGIDAETIVRLPAACLHCKELAGKDHYEDLLNNCADAAISSAMQMGVPQVGFRER
ncbi:MAG: NHLP-related RiPP peptide [Dokdonella sp.]